MSLIFERIQTKGIAELSYLVGEDSSGIAAVIDPRANVGIYLRLAANERYPSPIFLRPTSTPT